MSATVTVISDHKIPENYPDEGSLRRQAIQIAAQLPTDAREARRVLELATVLVNLFLEGSRLV